MWRLITLTTATILLLSSQASSSSIPPRVASIRSRNLVTDGSISDSYDFIIVGGGTAGLILGARLSEDSDTTVLVLEAGHSGDDVAGTINVPDNTYYNSLTKSEYDWAYSTAPQTNMNDHELVWPRGKVLGGSSAINGMYAVRPPQVEVEAWQSLIASEDGADEWSWDSFNAAMIKSETFTPPTAETQELAGITFDESFHGDDGPMHSSYPGYQLTFNGQWTPTLNSIGIESRQDGFGGENWGASISASYINPTNWTRSYSRSGYLDPLPPRSNLDVLADATVTRIVFEKNDGGDLVATGVEYAANADAPRTTVSVKKEVVLAAGVVGSPQVLLLSGVGPSDVLESVGIEVQNALPGVGQHLQDHLVAPIYWSTDVETAGDLQASGLNTPEFLSYINSATAYVNLTAIMGAGAKEELVQSLADAADASASLVPSQSSEVIEGYKAMYAKSVELLRDTPVGSIELLLALTGAGAVGIQAGLQHPLSPGHIYLKSNNPFEYPVIDPGYLGHTGDLTILREGMKLARIAGNTPPLSDLLTGEMSPGPDVETDEQWEEWLKSNAHTEYHPRGSCSMLPLAHGGVINAKLQVYGTTNVRVADSSIFPIDMSCHLQAPTIGVAEKAAEIIRAQYSSNGSGSGSGSGSSGGSSGNGSSDDDDSDAAMSLHTASVTLLGAWLAVALLL